MSLNIKKIRRIIADRSLDFIRSCERDKKLSALILACFPGAGKTATIMKTIDSFGYNWMYFSPFHKIIEENLKYSNLREYDFIHLKGKNQEGMCLSKDLQKILKQRVSIEPFCETKCPYRHDGCPYYEIRDKIESYPESWAGVHAHITTYLQNFLFNIEYRKRKMFNHYDVLIIDEFPFQVFFDQKRITRRDIDDIRDVVDKLPESDEKWFVMNFLNELSLASGTIEVNYGRLKSLLEFKRNLDLEELEKQFNVELFYLVQSEKIKRIPKNIIFNLKLIHKENPPIEKLKYIIYKHIFDGWTQGGIYITTSNLKYFKTLPIPVIALDATADIKAWNVLLNRKCDYEKIDIEYKNIYQSHTKARYPTSSWIEMAEKRPISETGKKLAELIIQICRRKENSVLLCCNKRIKVLLEKFLKENYERENYEFGIYYNLRSRNSFYGKCDTCIITHEPNIPPIHLDIMKNVIDWDLDLLSELMTKSEILQGIGRIRQNILMTPEGRERETIEIYILPGALDHSVKLLPEVKLIPYANMYVGTLLTLREVVIDTIKRCGKVSLKSLREYTKGLCSYETLKKEIKNLYELGYLSNYKYIIEYVYDEQEATKPKYKRDIGYGRVFENNF